MIACGREDRNWSDKKTDGEDGLKTLECLRGRLQAERQASRSAKKDAELMGNKLIELEKQLKEEIKLKKRAEKKLMLLKKKLESLTISVSDDQLSCESSTTSSNQQKLEDQEQKKESKNQIRNPMSSLKMEDNASETSNSIEEHSSPQVTSSSNSNSKTCQSYEDSKIYQESVTSSKASKTEIDIEKDEFVDDTWALVPVSWPEPPPEKPVVAEGRIMSGSVEEVLDVLRHVRERLKCSVEGRRNMIRVGPAC